MKKYVPFLSKCFLIAFGFVASTYSLACINETHAFKDAYNKTNSIVGFDPLNFYKPRISIIDKKAIDINSQINLNEYESTKEVSYYSDYAANLIYLGEYEKAITIYLEIEKSHPNEYNTASNIGTAYELIGDNAKALYWIRKAISINPKSHEGSEWIHVKILEHKINPKSKSIFGLQVDNENERFDKNSEKLLDNFRHQLNERTKFVKPKDVYVAEMFYNYGYLLLQKHTTVKDKTGTKEFALEAFILAKTYGYESEKLDDKLNVLSKELNKKLPEFHKTESPKPKDNKYNFSNISITIVSILVLLASIVYLLNSRRKKRK